MIPGISPGGVLWIPGSTEPGLRRWGSGPNVLVTLPEPLTQSNVPAESWPASFDPVASIDRGEPCVGVTNGYGYERFGDRCYQSVALDIARSYHPGVRWAPHSLKVGDDVRCASIALFGVVNTACVAIIAACERGVA